MDRLGTGRATAISDSYMAKMADDIGCHPADLEAIAEVESSGFGWFPDGRMKILFEKHHFYKNLPDDQRKVAVKGGLARQKFIKPKDGGYKDQGTADQRYDLLARAIAINEEAAYRSISMGRFQIMGFNHGICGFPSAKRMFERFVESEAYQLAALASFLEENNLYPALRARNWAAIEERYNGGGLNGVYAARMKEASARLRAGKWKNYKAGSMAVQPVPAPASEPVQRVEPVPAPQVPPEVQTPPVGKHEARGWFFEWLLGLFRK